MRLDVDLQNLLSFRLRVPVEQNKASVETPSTPCVVFSVKSSEQDVYMSGGLMTRDTRYNIEVYGEDVDGVDATAEAARSLLNGYIGAMGMSFVLGGFVEEQDGDYISKVDVATDAGLHVNGFVWRAVT